MARSSVIQTCPSWGESGRGTKTARTARASGSVRRSRRISPPKKEAGRVAAAGLEGRRPAGGVVRPAGIRVMEIYCCVMRTSSMPASTSEAVLASAASMRMRTVWPGVVR